MIIKSLLSCDLYKYTMLQVFFREFPDVTARYKFKCRNTDVNLLEFKDEIMEEINCLCELRLTQEELDYLENFPYFSDAFINYLEDFRLKKHFVHVGERDGNLDIHFDGPLTNVSMFEIFVLKIVHEVYSRNVNPTNDLIIAEGRKRLVQKIAMFKEFERVNGYKPIIAEFGGRRAYTTDWHYFVTKNLADNGVIVGTSDVDLARRLNIKPIGTMAHEFLTMMQVFTHPMNSQRFGFETWLDFYGNDLNILLSDTLGDKKFLIDFTPDIAHRASGVRHDSGCPFQFGEMMIAHYEALGINPKDKLIVFSDGLDFETVFRLEERFHGRIQTVYGVGTYLSNDVGLKPLQNVIKQVECNGHPVCKLSNNFNKAMCEDLDYMNYLKSCLDKI